MTFKQLQDEVIALRFDESKRASVKLWINLGYVSIWNKGDWTFKTTSSDLTVVSGDNSPAMPADFAQALALYDSQGNEIMWMPRKDWEDQYLSSSGGKAEAYTLVNRQIYLGPQSVSGDTLQLSYRRRVSHVDAVSGIIGGVFVEDSDQPLWPAEYDYVLIYEAALQGGPLLDDIDISSIQAKRDDLLQDMKDELTRDVEEQFTQWSGNEYQFGRY